MDTTAFLRTLKGMAIAPRLFQPWASRPPLLIRALTELRKDSAWVQSALGMPSGTDSAARRPWHGGYRCKAHLVGVQQGVADDVLTDVGCRSQAVQAVEQLHTGDVMLSGLLVQLIPEHTSHPLREKELTPVPFLLVRAWP